MHPLRISKNDLSPPSKSNQDHRLPMPSYSPACSLGLPNHAAGKTSAEPALGAAELAADGQ